MPLPLLLMLLLFNYLYMYLTICSYVGMHTHTLMAHTHSGFACLGSQLLQPTIGSRESIGQCWLSHAIKISSFLTPHFGCHLSTLYFLFCIYIMILCRALGSICTILSNIWSHFVSIPLFFTLCPNLMVYIQELV